MKAMKQLALLLALLCLGALAVAAQQPDEQQHELSLASLESSSAATMFLQLDAESEDEAMIEADADEEAHMEAEADADAEEADAAMLEVDAETEKAGKKKHAGKKAASKPKAPKALAPHAKAPKAPKAKASKPKAPKARAPKAAKSSKSVAAPKVARNKRRGSSRRGGNGKHGWGIAARPPRRVQQRLPAPRLTGAASTLTRANVRCVLCQFIVQKLKNSLTGTADAADAAAAPAADADASAASLMETFAFASAQEQSRVEAHVQAEAFADAKASAIPSLFDHGADAPKRFRMTDVLQSRQGRARFLQVRTGTPGAETDQARAAYLKLYATVYSSFESLCAKRMPLAYLPYCNDMLKSYRFFAQGVNYGDRAEQICMNGNFCDSRAYVRRVTHTTYIRQPGDA